MVRDAKTRMERKIAKDGLPYRVVREQGISGKRADLAILGADDSILVAVEFKYEPVHTGAMSSDDVVLWPEVEGDKGDIAKIKKYVGEDGVGVAYAILVDADGRWLRRHPNPPAGSEWRDWGNGVWALWTKADGEAARKAPPAGGAPLPAEIAGGGRPLPESGWVPLTNKESMQGSRPLTLRFPDDSTRALQYWNDLLPQVVGWLWESGRLTMDDIPVPSGPKRFIANTRPYHTKDRKFDYPKEAAGTPLIVETDTGDREVARKRAVKLLRRFGVDPSEALALR